MRAAVALPLTLTLLFGGGCAATSESPLGASFEPASQLAQPASAGASLARLPDAAGEVVSVIERRSAGVVSQDITLKADAAAEGENRIRIAVGPPDTGDAVVGPPLVAPEMAEIAGEMERELPEAEMQFASAVVQNSYGPFGYATGRSGGSSCIYAWQHVPASMANWGWSPNEDAMALRIRLCRTNATAEDLVAYVRALSISAPIARGGGEISSGMVTTGGDALDSAMAGI